MGFHLEPHYFPFNSSTINHRRQLYTINIFNQLILIAFIVVAFTFHQTIAFEELPQASEQQDTELQQQIQSTCETKTLDEVPPDPVSLSSNFTDIITIKYSQQQFNQ